MNAAPRKLYILGAGPPHRGQQPSALASAGSRPALSWIIGATRTAVESVHFIGGFQAEAVEAEYPALSFTRNPEWASTGSAATLLHAPLDADAEALVTYSDIVFHAEAVDRLLRCPAPVCIAVDSHWRERYAGRTQADVDRCEKVIMRNGGVLRAGADLPADLASAEFVGLVLFRDEALRRLTEEREELYAALRTHNLSALVERLRLSGLEARCVDVKGDWAELNEARDVARFVMGTKAETLARLRERVTQSVIQDQISFVFEQWRAERELCLARVRDRFGAARLVVRSSSNREDGFNAAAAGVYTSILNVDPTTGLAAAVDEVFESYGEPAADEQVLIQPFLAGVAMHGVIFTRTLDRGAPYYVMNYDESGDTEAITSGKSTESRTLVAHRNADIGLLPAPYGRILAAVKELEALLSYDALDIEFAVDAAGQVNIFQVRPIAVNWGENNVDDARCDEVVAAARSAWTRVSPRSPLLPGGAPVFGLMPDWNPAEIIGTAPRALATSLYRQLIMDDVWATQRAEYGYRDVRPQPLLASFGGRPYVDVRASFSSFVPASVPDDLAGRLVAFYLDWLKARPHLHDKVEFDVVPTCMGLTFDKWRTRLTEEGGFSQADVDALAQGLHAITVAAFSRTGTDIAKTDLLKKRFETLRAAEDLQPIDRARRYLEDARRLGTLPFAHLARSGFVAVTLLRSAVDAGVISRPAMDAFMASLHTVTREFSHDIRAAAEGSLSLERLVERYGHLRPGTYEISSPCYASDVETYILPLVAAARTAPADPEPDLSPWLQERGAFFNALQRAGLPSEPQVVEMFLREAIAGRELAKFHFTRNLSAALEALAAFGESLGLSRDEVSDLTIDQLYAAGEGDALAHVTRLREAAETARAAQRATAACPMPALITAPDDTLAFWLMQAQPNFVSTAKVRAEVVCLDGAGAQEADLSGKIVLIPQADPGYDWLFGQSIAALVTMYGGANSHMAIRSAEFRLPAAIGVGERLYDELKAARMIELDPANQRIEVIS